MKKYPDEAYLFLYWLHITGLVLYQIGLYYPDCFLFSWDNLHTLQEYQNILDDPTISLEEKQKAEPSLIKKNRSTIVASVLVVVVCVAIKFLK